jgi:hypothetical protein
MSRGLTRATTGGKRLYCRRFSTGEAGTIDTQRNEEMEAVKNSKFGGGRSEM